MRSAIDAEGREQIMLAEPVPVQLIYVTAWVDADDARVHFREDVYHRDRELGERLSAVTETDT